MTAKIIAVILVGLSAIFANRVSDQGIVSDVEVEIGKNADMDAQTLPATDPQQSEFPAPVSKVAQISADATYVEMAQAFDDDYARAAQSAGVPPNHPDLQYQGNSWGAAYVTWYDESNNFHSYAIDPPSTYHRIWFTGYPQSDEWMIREIQLILMAADSQLSASQALVWANELYESAGHLRWSATHRVLPNGIQTSITRNERGLTTFWIKFAQ